LSETLESLAAQTYQDFRIIVLDNASTDHTGAVVRRFSERRQVSHHRHPSNIGGDNFLSASDLALAEWVMIFHDDDLIHPCYLEYAMAALVEHPGCRLVASNFKGVNQVSLERLSKQELSKDIWFFDCAAHFASFCFTLNKIHFGSAIYNRNQLRQLTKEGLVRFGKIADRPALIETVRNGGSAIVFKAEFIQYRLHPNQDSQSSNSGPFLDEAIALTQYYAQVMGKNWRTSSGRSFLINNRAYLKGIYKWCSDRSTKKFNQFVRDAEKAGAATKLAYVPRPLMRLLKKTVSKLDPKFF